MSNVHNISHCDVGGYFQSRDRTWLLVLQSNSDVCHWRLISKTRMNDGRREDSFPSTFNSIRRLVRGLRIRPMRRTLLRSDPLSADREQCHRFDDQLGELHAQVASFMHGIVIDSRADGCAKAWIEDTKLVCQRANHLGRVTPLSMVAIKEDIVPRRPRSRKKLVMVTQIVLLPETVRPRSHRTFWYPEDSAGPIYNVAQNMLSRRREASMLQG